MKRLHLILFSLLIIGAASAQERSELTLTEAYRLLEENYPLLKNVPLTEAAYRAEIDQLKSTRKPTVQFKTDATLQSERPNLDNNEQVPLQIDLPLYSVTSYLEARYQLYDGGRNRAQRKQEEAQLRANLQSLETERYTLRERVNQLFIGYLLNQQQATMLQTTLADLQTRRRALEEGQRYGTVLPSEVAQLKVRELEIDAQRSDLRYANQGLLATLSDLTGVTLTPEATLILPELPAPTQVPALSRPEQLLFQQKKQALLAREGSIAASRRPTFGIFAQGGVGYPNPLNFFDNGTAPYGIAGVNFQWNLVNWKKQQHQRESLSLQAQQIANQEETFVFNANTQTGEYLATVARLTRQLENDQEIVTLQADVLRQLASQLEGGVITTADYLTQVNAELQARQQRELHQIQLIQAQLQFLTDRGVEDLRTAPNQPNTLPKN